MALEGGEGSASRPGRSLPPGKNPVPIVQEAGWAPGPVWTGAENLASTGIRFPERPAPLPVAVPTELPGPHKSRSCPSFLDVRWLTRSKYHTEDPQILVARTTWLPVFVHLAFGCELYCSWLFLLSSLHVLILRNVNVKYCMYDVKGKVKGKGKAIPLKTWTGPEGSRRLRLPDFKTVGTWRWQGCQPYAPAAFTPSPQEIFLVLSSARGWVDRKAIVRSARSFQGIIWVTPSGIGPATFRLVA